MAASLAGGGRNRGDSKEMSEGGLAAHAFWVVAHRDQECGAGEQARSLDSEQLWRGWSDQSGQVLVEVANLRGQSLMAWPNWSRATATRMSLWVLTTMVTIGPDIVSWTGVIRTIAERWRGS